MTSTIDSVPANRGEAREQAILDAALDLIAEVGYDRMSMDGLAARAQASKATIYRRWPGKAEVVAEAIRRRACPVGTTPADTGSLRGDFLAATRTKWDTLNGEDGPLFLGLLMAARNDAQLGVLLRSQMRGDGQPLLCEIVTRAIGRGEVPPSADPALVHELLPALVLHRLIVGDELTDDAFIAHIVDVFVIPLLSGCGPAVAVST